MLCPSDTPEGEVCGLVKNLALMTHITTDQVNTSSLVLILIVLNVQLIWVDFFTCGKAIVWCLLNVFYRYTVVHTFVPRFCRTKSRSIGYVTIWAALKLKCWTERNSVIPCIIQFSWMETFWESPVTIQEWSIYLGTIPVSQNRFQCCLVILSSIFLCMLASTHVAILSTFKMNIVWRWIFDWDKF